MANKKKRQGGGRIVSARGRKVKKFARKAQGGRRARGARRSYQQVPMGLSEVERNLTNYSMGPAPREETLGVGSRQSLHFVGPAVKQMAAVEGTCFVGFVGTTAQQSDAVSSAFAGVASATKTTSMWQLSASATTIVGTLLLPYSRFVIRKAYATFKPNSIINTPGRIAFARVNRQYLTDSIEEAGSFSKISSVQNSVRGNIWKEMRITLVDDRDMRKPAARMYPTDYSSAALLEQFALVAATDVRPAADTVVGDIEFDVVVDVYCLRGEKQTPLWLAEVAKEGKEAKEKPVEDEEKVRQLQEQVSRLSRRLESKMEEEARKTPRENYVMVSSTSSTASAVGKALGPQSSGPRSQTSGQPQQVTSSF